ncbi:MAG: YjbQ family protein, partial [Armatimonadetes bacterium]|nr:YjbQ family protein [Armatimonadota bacterium]
MVIGTLGLKMHIETLDVLPDRGPQFIDLTDYVEDILDRSGIRNGMVVVFCRHTTAAVKINENEPELIKDMESILC